MTGKPQPAVGTVCFKGEDVLLIRRGTKPLAGDWSIPGGRIEFGERAEVAALRELAEETGITARLTGLVDVVDDPRGGRRDTVREGGEHLDRVGDDRADRR